MSRALSRSGNPANCIRITSLGTCSPTQNSPSIPASSRKASLTSTFATRKHDHDYNQHRNHKHKIKESKPPNMTGRGLSVDHTIPSSFDDDEYEPPPPPSA